MADKKHPSSIRETLQELSLAAALAATPFAAQAQSTAATNNAANTPAQNQSYGLLNKDENDAYQNAINAFLAIPPVPKDYIYSTTFPSTKEYDAFVATLQSINILLYESQARVVLHLLNYAALQKDIPDSYNIFVRGKDEHWRPEQLPNNGATLAACLFTYCPVAPHNSQYIYLSGYNKGWKTPRYSAMVTKKSTIVYPVYT